MFYNMYAKTTNALFHYSDILLVNIVIIHLAEIIYLFYTQISKIRVQI